jgi:hypothetical protein
MSNTDPNRPAPRSEEKLLRGRTRGRRVELVDASGDNVSCCVELDDGRLFWLGSDEVLIPEDEKISSAAEGR